MSSGDHTDNLAVTVNKPCTSKLMRQSHSTDVVQFWSGLPSTMPQCTSS